MAEKTANESKYVRPSREKKFFRDMAVLFLFSLFVMPQYFGIPTPFFDFTILRIMIVIIILMILADVRRKNQFLEMLVKCKYSLALIPYLGVISYTMVLRTDLNAFLNPFIEIICLYLMIYVIRYELGLERTVNIVCVFLWILCIEGMIEFGMGKSLFSYLETIKGTYTGSFVRSGNYRIMGPCTHSLGYGILLISATPLACYDFRQKEIFLFHRPVLLVLIICNIFLTGSRSSLSVFAVEFVLLLLFSSREKQRKTLIILFGLVMALVSFLAVGFRTGVGQYILLQITSIMDSVFGTQFSIQFGANMAALGSSSNYRDQLIYVFGVSWLNPLLGIGRQRSFSSEINGSFIQSIDNFYVAEFVRYAYPGLFSYLLFLFVAVKDAMKKYLAGRDRFCLILFIGIGCYLLNLWWIDSNQTLKYLYVLFALLEVFELPETKKEMKQDSKYLKKG